MEVNSNIGELRKFLDFKLESFESVVIVIRIKVVTRT
jgi:hypothetical protein